MNPKLRMADVNVRLLKVGEPKVEISRSIGSPMAVDSTGFRVVQCVCGESKMGNRPVRMKRGCNPLGDVVSVWLCVVMPFGSTVKKASQKVVEGFY